MKYIKIILYLLLALVCTSCGNLQTETETVPGDPEVTETVPETETAEPEEAETSAGEPAEERTIPELHLTLAWGATATDYRPAEYHFIDTDGDEMTVTGTITHETLAKLTVSD